MKQLFLKSLLWTVQTVGRATVGLIRFLTWTPVMVVLLALNLAAIVTGQAVALNILAAVLLTLALASKFIARKPSAEAEAAPTFEEVVDEATRIRDEAATALQAEAQAVVDRIKARTEAANDVRLIPNDPPSTIRVVIDDKAPRLRGPEIDPTLKAARKARPTTIVEENGVQTIKPKRPRKPKGGQ